MRSSFIYLLITLFFATYIANVSAQINKVSVENSKKEEFQLTKNLNLSSTSEFYYSIAKAFNKVQKGNALLLGDSIYIIAKQKQWIPITFSDTAIFLYLSETTEDKLIYIIGDLNEWSIQGTPQVKLERYRNTRLFAGIYTAPSNKTRIDYQLLLNDTLMLDPGNNKTSFGGYGKNSELSMPKYTYSTYTEKRINSNKGTLSPNIIIHSNALNEDFNYRVYLPKSYNKQLVYPVLFVTDGQEYSDNRLGALVNVTDNLNSEGLIIPPIIVFIDPRDPITGQNRRNSLYVGNLRFISFMDNELYPEIKENYAISNQANKTAILGTSLGGFFSADLGLKSTKFGLLAIQSPAFWYGKKINYNITNIWDIPKDTSINKIYIDAGMLEQSAYIEAIIFQKLIQSKGYEFKFVSSYEAHSWGNWRAKLEYILIYFFKK